MKIVVFGEILFDIIDGDEYIGGAPFNFAAHMTKLGFDTHLITCLGEDRLGREAMAKIRSLDMNEDFIKQTSEHPTGTVSVSLKKGQPEFEIAADTAWDNISVEDSPALEYEMWDLMYFGTLAQRSSINRDTLYSLMDDTLSARHFFFDVNLRQQFYSKEILEKSFQKATICKLNSEEALTVTKLLGKKKKNPEDAASWLSTQYNLATVIITNGSKNVYILHEGTSYTIPVEAAEVADTVGSGDAFSAGFCFGLLQGLAAQEAGQLGAVLGSYVATKTGAVPEYSETLIETLLEPLK